MLFFVLHTCNQKTVATELILQAYRSPQYLAFPSPKTLNHMQKTPYDPTTTAYSSTCPTTAASNAA